jgi:hypothetical protein
MIFFKATILSKINRIFNKYNFSFTCYSKKYIIVLELLFQYSKKYLGTFLTNSRVYNLHSKSISRYILFIF